MCPCVERIERVHLWIMCNLLAVRRQFDLLPLPGVCHLPEVRRRHRGDVLAVPGAASLEARWEGRSRRCCSFVADWQPFCTWFSSSVVRQQLLLLQCFDTWSGDSKGIWPLKNAGVMCCWWQFDWSFARLIAPVVTTTSIILSSYAIENADILVLANLGPPGKCPFKWRERERERERDLQLSR